MAEVRVEPSEILVEGPKHILETLQTINCVPIDISGSTKSFTREGQIVSMIQNRPVRAKDSFKIVVVIGKELSEREIKVNVNIVIPPDFPYNVKTKPSEIKFKVKGPSESIQRLSPNHFNVFVNVANIYPDISDLKPGRYPGVAVEVKLSKDIPEGIVISEIIESIPVEIKE